MTKLYLAGPMTGIPQFNFPAFHAAAIALRAKGFDIVSPAELDSESVKAEAMKSPDGKAGEAGAVGGETWGDMLARDVKIIADTVDGVIFLPYWYKSRGARLEAFVGLLTGKSFFFYNPNPVEDDPAVSDMTRELVQKIIRENMP